MSSELAAVERPGLMRLRLNGPVMGTRWSAQCDLAPDIDPAPLRERLANVVERVDAQMSPWKPDSDLSRLNRAAPDVWVSLPADTLVVLARALEIGRLSAGAFDPAVGALVDAWGFGAVRDTPDASAIQMAARAAGRPAHQWLELDLTGERACKRTPMCLDLCGIAKGYAVDLMADVMRASRVNHALVALDGELRACGPQADGRQWSVALESPRHDARLTHGVIGLADAAVATSGDYRHWVHVGGMRLSHTMDGRRAAPVANDVASVTVLAPDCIDADAWATALLVSGPGEGLALARRMGLDALFLLRRQQGLVELGTGCFA